MPSVSDWKVPTSAQPKPEDYGYDLERAFTSVVGVRAIIPADAYTAETLGTDRAGNGVFIRNGLVQTLAKLDVPALEIGQSAAASIGERVVVAGVGGRTHSVAARIVAKQEF